MFVYKLFQKSILSRKKFFQITFKLILSQQNSLVNHKKNNHQTSQLNRLPVSISAPTGGTLSGMLLTSLMTSPLFPLPSLENFLEDPLPALSESCLPARWLSVPIEKCRAGQFRYFLIFQQ